LRSARVGVVLRDGRRFERFVDEPSGSARHPLSDEAVVAKFMDLSMPVIGEMQSHLAADALLNVHLARDTGELLSRLEPPAQDA
jgi:hypothetical protein